MSPTKVSKILKLLDSHKLILYSTLISIEVKLSTSVRLDMIAG